MVIPQPEPYNLVSTEGSDMDVSDDEVVIYDPPQTDTQAQEDDDMDSVISYQTAPSSPETPAPQPDWETECQRLTRQLENTERENAELSDRISQLKVSQEDLKLQMLELKARTSLARKENPARINRPPVEALREEYSTLQKEKNRIKSLYSSTKNSRDASGVRMNRLLEFKNIGRNWTDQDEIGLSNIRAEYEHAKKEFKQAEMARADNKRANDEFKKKLELLGIALKTVKQTPEPVTPEPSMQVRQQENNEQHKRRLSAGSETDSSAKRSRLSIHTPGSSNSVENRQSLSTSNMASVDNGFRDVSNKKDYTSMSYQERQEELVNFIEDMIVDYEKYSKEINGGQASTNKQANLLPTPKAAEIKTLAEESTLSQTSSTISLKEKEEAIKQAEGHQNNRRLQPNEFVAGPLDSNQTQQNHSNTLSSSAISLKGKEKATEQQVEEHQNNGHFRPYRSIVNSLGLNQGQQYHSNLPTTKTFCNYEAKGGQCNDKRCDALHLRDFGRN
ncbi:hypothetical protein G6F62_003769 [Rhizopus arrhizus]|nr:hypothetical protein G6F42_002414 [Rhizopus arrhizus]KAG1348783.1 hypothetical protein G6F62_003769 [Rhizopus arrhizus]KAG1380987.1 hypothetical protein G6F61_003564 [Rhizopus arrhizus]